MVLKTWRVLLALGLLFAPVSARAASEYPLVITGGKIVQLPSADSLKLRITGSVQCVHVDSGGVLTGTGADCGSSSGTVTGITAGAGLSGGTITTSGTIAIDINGVTLGNIAQSAANTMLGNWTGSTANVAANAMPSCADSGGNHLNYVSGTGVTCGTSGGAAGTVTSSGSPVSGDYAKFTSATNITTAGVSGSGNLCLVTSCVMVTPTLGVTTVTGVGAASTPAMIFTGLPFVGTGTTGFPLVLVQPTGGTPPTASTAWSTSGTVYGANMHTATLGNFADFQIDGTSKFSVSSTGGVISAAGVQISGGSTYLFNGRDSLSSPAAGKVQLGNGDAATATAQTLKVQNVVAGTSNVAGADFTVEGSQGTGSGIGGKIVFSTAGTGAAATVQNTEIPALTIDKGSGATAGAITHAGATTLSAALTYGGVTLSNAVTGTGNMVLSTSPTLVTPALGTPSAVVLTNATGLVASTGTTATGSPSSTTFLRGDNTWSTPSGVASVGSQWFGDGSDGTLTVSSGTTTLTRDTYYSNVTISGTATINTSGFRLFVSGNLDMSNAPAGAIHFWNGLNTINGGAGVNNSGGPQGTTASNGGLGATCGFPANSTTTSPNGGTGAGVAATAPGSAFFAFALGVSGGGGSGGAVGATAGGAATAGVTATSLQDIRYATQTLATWNTNSVLALIKGGVSATAGSSGAGDGVGAGGGGGGAGGATGIIQVFAATITRGGSTAAGAITVKGGNGGAGGAGSGGTNRGGGGGGGGASGGLVAIYYNTLAGSTATNMIDASGGDGGAGANGTGTGTGGNGGDAGGQGGIDLYNMTTGVGSLNRGAVAKVTGNVRSGSTGGATQTNTFQVSL